MSSPSAKAALNGAYIQSLVNMTSPNPATKTMLDALKKYDTAYSGGLPDLGTWYAYVEAQLMIKGLELAGNNPTRSDFVSALRKVSSFNADGILAALLTSPISGRRPHSPQPTATTSWSSAVTTMSPRTVESPGAESCTLSTADCTCLSGFGSVGISEESAFGDAAFTDQRAVRT